MGRRWPALRDVSFDLIPGEVHALAGENGAGKSTLMKILSGAVHGYTGTLRLNGVETRFHSPGDARRAGVAMIHQELCVAPNLSVLENLFLGQALDTTRLGFVRWGAMRRRARRWMEEFGWSAPLDTPAGKLAWSERQLLEITRALHSGASILLMDEPTSALGPTETARLFAAVARFKESGRAVVYTSHFLDETLAIADRVLVLRNGEAVARHRAAETSVAELVAEMTGHERAEQTGDGARLEASRNRVVRAAVPPLLRVSGLGCGRALRNVSFTLAPGEIAGVFGAADAGFMALGRVLFGQWRATGGTVWLDDKPIIGPGRSWNPGDACAAGMGFLSESRPENLFGEHSLRENATLAALRTLFPNGLIRAGHERAAAGASLAALDVRPPGLEQRAGQLSGGNQQKVLLGRWLMLPGLRLLIVCEPTRGMDVGAKEEVVRVLRTVARDRGAGVLVMSSEPELLLGLAERILVFRKGALVTEGEARAVDKAWLLLQS